MSETSENAIPLTEIYDVCIQQKNIRLFILREDLIHPEISGNKWRKLKYNIQTAIQGGFDSIITFGGAYSNHIAATAAAGARYGIKTIGIIRGEKVNNPTLDLAIENGMELKFVSRDEYKRKDASEYPNCYVIPEGGSNVLAVKGCTEIVDSIDVDFDVICCACGTGGTIAGIIASTEKTVLGFPALKGGGFLKKDIENLLSDYSTQFKLSMENNSWDLVTDYHFGGYAKIKSELVDFIKDFKQNNNIELDLIYTGKMLFGLYDLIKKSDQFDNKTIIVIHTGGLQGNIGFKKRFGIEI